LLRVARVSAFGLVHVEQRRALRDHLETIDELRLVAVSRALYLFARHFAVANLRDFVEERLLDLCRVDPRTNESIHDELRPEDAGLLLSRDVLSDLLIVDESLVEAALLSVRQDTRDKIEFSIARREVTRGLPGQRHFGQLDVVLHRRADDAGQRGLFVAEARRTGVGWLSVGGNGREPGLERGSYPVRIKVARDDDGCVGGVVPRRKELLHVVDGGRLEILVGPDDGMVVRVPLRPEKLRQLELFHTVGSVLDALSPFVPDHIALEVQLVHVDERPEIAHSVGFEPQEKRKSRGWCNVEVVGAVLGRPRVVASARTFHPSVERARGCAPRPHEHQVFEEVCEPGAPRALHPRTHAIRDVDGNLRNGVIHAQDGDHAVGERRPRERDAEFLCTRGGAAEKHDQPESYCAVPHGTRY